jgi:hypothetical protein
VSDSGRGMSKDYLQGKLFTPFAQEDQLAPGTGLGLSIIRQIIKNLGGKIEVRSKRGSVNHGTNVCVSIPMTHCESSTSPTLDPLANIGTIFKGMNICLSDISQQSKGATPDFEMSSLKTICESWYGMRVHSGLDSSTVPDMYLIVEDESNHESLKNGELFKRLQRKSNQGKPLQAIIICKTSSSFNVLERESGMNDSTKILDFVGQPCGPRKLGKSLLRCFKRRAELATFPPVPELVLRHSYPTPPQDEGLQPTSQQEPILTAQTRDVVTSPLNTPPGSAQMESPPPVTPGETPLDAGPFLLVDDNHINLQVCRPFTCIRHAIH